METFGEIQSFLRADGDTDIIVPFPLLTKNAVESLRYRAEVCDAYYSIFFEDAQLDIKLSLLMCSACFGRMFLKV